MNPDEKEASGGRPRAGLPKAVLATASKSERVRTKSRHGSSRPSVAGGGQLEDDLVMDDDELHSLLGV